MTNLPKLYYFDLPNRGEAIRLALHIGGVPFEDVRFDYDEWMSHYKSISPNGLAPWLILDSYTYFETQPLLLWASALTRLLPREATSVLAAKTLVDACEPLWHSLAYYYWKIDTAPEGYNQILPHLKQIEAQLSRTQSSEGYSVSAGLSFADLVLAVIIWNIVTIPVFQSQFHQPSFPRVCRVYSLVMSHPAVLDYWKTTRHPMPASLGPISIDFYRNLTSEISAEDRHNITQNRGSVARLPLLRRSQTTPDGADAVTLLLTLGEAECEVERRQDMSNKIELRCDDLSYTNYHGIVLWAATYGNLMHTMNPEECLTANIVATQCCDIYELHQQCAFAGVSLADKTEQVDASLQVIEKILQQSSMTASWSDVCVVVMCALLKFVGFHDLQQSYPYIYLKKIQSPSLHPKIESELRAFV